MIATITRQDLQTALDSARNRIISGQPSRNELQIMLNHLNDSIVHILTSLHFENQEILRFTAKQTELILRRLDSVEASLISIEKNLK